MVAVPNAPNAESLLRLVSAVLAEVDDEWTTGRLYLDLAKKDE